LVVTILLLLLLLLQSCRQPNIYRLTTAVFGPLYVYCETSVIIARFLFVYSAVFCIL